MRYQETFWFLISNVREPITKNKSQRGLLSQWEAQKCILRGKFLALKTSRKKAHQARTTNSTHKLKTLVLAHKQIQAQQTYLDLTQTRELLLEELNHKIIRKFVLKQKLFYEFGNKYGKYLAKAIQTNKANTNIHTINDSHGRPKVMAPDIASQIEAYHPTLTTSILGT